MRSFDVIILDSVGVPFSGDSPKHNGLGGSEFEQILLAEGLAARGYRVACINKLPSWCKVRGVDYLPLEMLSYETFDCATLVLERNTPCPHADIIKAEHPPKRWLTDAVAQAAPDGAQLVHVSEWQMDALAIGRGNSVVVHNMLPDRVYNIDPICGQKSRNTKAGSFIYASAAIKGLPQTLNYFASMRKTKEFKNATLKVLNPGYDLPKAMDADGVTFLGALPFHRVVEEMQTCRSLLHLSTFKETFGIVHALAEVLGLNTFVLQSTGPDALSEVCNSKIITDKPEEFNQNLAMFGRDPQMFKPVKANDYRVSTIMPRWLEVLGLPYAPHLSDGDTDKQEQQLLVHAGRAEHA